MKLFSKNSIKTYFFKSTFIVFFIAVIVFMLVMFSFSYNTVYTEYREHIESLQNKMLNSTELMINAVNFSSIELMTNNDIYRTVNSDNMSAEEKHQVIKRYLSASIDNNQIISDAVLITHDNIVYRSNDSIEYIPSSLYLLGIDTCTTAAYVEISSDGENSYSVIGRQFKNFNTGRNIGYLLIYLDNERFSSLYNTEEDNSNITLLLDEDNRVILHPDSSSFGKSIDLNQDSGTLSKKIDGEKKYIYISAFSEELKNVGFDWRIVTLVDSKSILSIALNSARTALTVGLAALLLSLVFSLFIMNSALRPITRMQQSMKNLKLRKPKTKRRSGKFDEILQLENDYIDMTHRIDALIKKNQEDMTRQRELELTALQAQINPHFLYNTLDVTIWIAKIKKEPEIEKIISSLANFFRMSLHNGDKYITVSEEIALINSYIAIEQIRFPYQLDVKYNIEENLMEQKILKLTLQPFVENALKHGIRGLSSKSGTITINGITHGENIIFEIIDNGKGFDIKSLDLDSETHIGSGGYGIKNVHERIVLEYGDKYGVSIFSEPNRGTRVIIKIRQEKESSI